MWSSTADGADSWTKASTETFCPTSLPRLLTTIVAILSSVSSLILNCSTFHWPEMPQFHFLFQLHEMLETSRTVSTNFLFRSPHPPHRNKNSPSSFSRSHPRFEKPEDIDRSRTNDLWLHQKKCGTKLPVEQQGISWWHQIWGNIWSGNCPPPHPSTKKYHICCLKKKKKKKRVEEGGIWIYHAARSRVPSHPHPSL